MESEVSASDSFAVHLRVLVWCGYAELRSARPAAKHLHRLYRFMILSCFTLYILLEAIYMVMVLDDLVAFARVTLLLLVHCAAFVKMATYRLKFNSIQTIINGFNEPLLNPENVTSRRTISDSVTTSKFIVKAFVSTSLCTCVLWSLFPAIEYLRERGVRFYYWLFDIDYSMSPKRNGNRPVTVSRDIPCRDDSLQASSIVHVTCRRHSHVSSGRARYEIVTLCTAAVTTLIAVANTALDALVAAVLAQCKTQLTILRHNLEHLPVKCQEMTNAGEAAHNAALLRELAACMQHYAKIMQISRKFLSIFGGAIFFQFGCSGWIICMTAYKLANVRPTTMEFASLVLFLICMLLELFLFCYYGNEVKVESELLTQSVFAASWPETPHAFRKALVVVMERFKRPLKPVAGLIIPLSLETFVKVLKSSYTYYAVLKSRNNE